ncbi:Dabb family protein [Diaphorobacter sp. JS3051]|uniref:Dabb family protein n=1 Tax=Diaphorobacter sp. JS3051 TaxID=2792224 RepID=UPI0018CB8E71|nr:Dabb family protein [Diaphorobacter sp. JS3051]
MIKHIVMWKLKGSTPAELQINRLTVKQALESLRGKVPGLLHLEVGLDQSDVDYAFDVVLYSEFESVVALAAYADHPEHQRVRREMSDLRIQRHQVDYFTN